MANGSSSPVAYEVVTKAPKGATSLVMVHGVSQDYRLFNRQVAWFERAYRLILIDLPGHGRSSHVRGPYGLQEYASSIYSVLKDLDAQDCHFWGTHIGAGAGLLLACQNFGVFRSLVLEAPVFPGRPLPAVSEILKRISAAANDHGIAAARKLWWEEGGWFDVMRRLPNECRAAEQRQIIDDFDGQPWLETGLISRPVMTVEEKLAAFSRPSLIINGEHDLPDFLNIANDLAAIMPSVEKVSIPEAGGFPLWEFPGRVNPIVSDFLGRH